MLSQHSKIEAHFGGLADDQPFSAIVSIVFTQVLCDTAFVILATISMVPPFEACQVAQCQA